MNREKQTDTDKALQTYIEREHNLNHEIQLLRRMLFEEHQSASDQKSCDIRKK